MLHCRSSWIGADVMDVVLVLQRAGRHGQKRGLRQAHL